MRLLPKSDQLLSSLTVSTENNAQVECSNDAGVTSCNLDFSKTIKISIAREFDEIIKLTKMQVLPC